MTSCCPKPQPIAEAQRALVPRLHDGAEFGRLVGGLGPLQHRAHDRAPFALAYYLGVEADAHVRRQPTPSGRSRNPRFGAEAHKPKELVSRTLGDRVVTALGGDEVGDLAVIDRPRSLIAPLSGDLRLRWGY